MHKLKYLGNVRSSREAPLSLTTLAAFTRDQPDVDYQLVDESVDPVPLDARPDLVGISVMTGTACRAYAIADHFRGAGVPVVLGGVHVTLRPDEARQFADAIVVGMGETTWPELVKDFKAGQMKPEYRAPPVTSDFFPGVPVPRYDLVRKNGYMMPYAVQATRGCVHHCDFCTVPGVWERFQRRPVADVVADIKATRGRFAMPDVSPFDDLEYAKELLTAIIPLKKTWGALATSRITDDPEVFDLLVESGCRFLLIGFESVTQQNLNRIAKGFNKETDYTELMRRLHQGHIVVQGCFVFGFDEDGPDVFARTVDRVQELKIDIPRYSIYTPYPGTRLFARLEQEGRILDYDWANYDTMHVVIRPKGMSPMQLFEGFRWAYRETFKVWNIFRRTIGAGFWFPVAFFGNLTYRIFIKKLYNQKGFEMPLLRPVGVAHGLEIQRPEAASVEAAAAGAGCCGRAVETST